MIVPRNRETRSEPRFDALTLQLCYRRQLGEKPPFPIMPLCELFGLEVDRIGFADEIQALIWRRGGRSCAAVNRRLCFPARRFALAHELYHYLAHRRRMKPLVLYYSQTGWDAMDDAAADGFARELTMPARAVIEAVLDEGLGLRRLARRFRVPPRQVLTRLEELGIEGRIAADEGTSAPACAGVLEPRGLPRQGR